MTEDTKQLIVVFIAIIVGIVIMSAYNRNQTNCVVLAAQSGWSAKDAKEACK